MSEHKTPAAKPAPAAPPAPAPKPRINTPAKLRSGLTVTVGYYSSIAEIDKDAGEEGYALYAFNLYQQQKSALPEANEFVEAHLESIGFKADPKKERTEKKTVDGKEVITTVNDETPGERIARFIASVATGATTPPNGSKDGLAYLQGILDKHGPFNLDAAKAVRDSKPKTPPKFCLEAATRIVAGGTANINKWVGIFATIGHKVVLTGNAAADHTALAWGVHARDIAKKKAEAAEFGAPVK